MSTRLEHIEWCKSRALAYVDAGDLNEAFASMMSDLRKHPKTEDRVLMAMGMSLKINGHLDTAQKMREFINGFFTGPLDDCDP